MVLQGSGHRVLTRTTLAAGILTLLSTLSLLVLSHFEHCRTTRPSAIIQLFLLVTILLELPRLRTAWLLDGDDQNMIACLFTVTFALWVVLLQLESFQKWNHVTFPPESIPPEERQGIFGRTFFWWLMPMFFKGYSRTISMDDLFAIDDDLKGTRLHERLLKSWHSGKHHKRQSRLSEKLIEFVKSTTRKSTLLQPPSCGHFPPNSVLLLSLVLPSWGLVLPNHISSMLQLRTLRIIAGCLKAMGMDSSGHMRSVILDLL